MNRRTFIKSMAALVAIAAVPVRAAISSRVRERGPMECVFTDATGSHDWRDPGNWRNGIMPRSGDSVLIVQKARMEGFLAMQGEPIYLDRLTVLEGAMIG